MRKVSELIILSNIKKFNREINRRNKQRNKALYNRTSFKRFNKADSTCLNRKMF